jgi:thiol-disulfide isomerase/thioredoxin
MLSADCAKRKERPLVDMKAIHIALVVLALVLVLLSLRSSEGFEGEDMTILIFKAEWCGHCKTAAPEFAKLLAASPISLSGNRKAAVRMLDADQDKDAMAPYKDQVKGFPTILIQKGDKLIEYPGERKSEDVIAFATSV